MAANGQLPESSIAKTVLGVKVRNDLAKQTNQMAYAFYRKFKTPMRATDGYRDLATQHYLMKIKGPGLAAKPGTSNHGWGMALDLASGINSFSSATHKWTKANGPGFGWSHPYWARQGGGREEAWHFEGTPVSRNAPYVGIPGEGAVGFGQQGSKVKEVQELLRKAGYRGLVVDSDFGMGTGTYVVSFQKKHNLVQDGVVGPKTLAVLKSGKKAPIIKPRVPKPVAPKVDVRAVQRAVNAKADNVWGPDTDKRLWAVREASAYGGHDFPFGVKFAQDAVGTRQDGEWGPASGRAHTATVKELQKALGITADGVFGSRTQAALAALEKKAK